MNYSPFSYVCLPCLSKNKLGGIAKETRGAWVGWAAAKTPGGLSDTEAEGGRAQGRWLWEDLWAGGRQRRSCLQGLPSTFWADYGKEGKLVIDRALLNANKKQLQRFLQYIREALIFTGIITVFREFLVFQYFVNNMKKAPLWWKDEKTETQTTFSLSWSFCEECINKTQCLLCSSWSTWRSNQPLGIRSLESCRCYTSVTPLTSWASTELSTAMEKSASAWSIWCLSLICYGCQCIYTVFTLSTAL